MTMFQFFQPTEPSATQMTSADLERCEELFKLLKDTAQCLAQGDTTWCHELRGSRAPKGERGLPLPDRFWCRNCKNRTRGEQLIKEMRNG